MPLLNTMADIISFIHVFIEKVEKSLSLCLHIPMISFFVTPSQAPVIVQEHTYDYINILTWTILKKHGYKTVAKLLRVYNIYIVFTGI